MYRFVRADLLKGMGNALTEIDLLFEDGTKAPDERQHHVSVNLKPGASFQSMALLFGDLANLCLKASLEDGPRSSPVNGTALRSHAVGL